MNSSPIRDLARRHAAGELSQEDYRARRRDMISEIVEGKRPLTYEQQRPRGKRSKRSMKSPLAAAAAGAIVIVALLVVWLTLMYSGARPGKAAHPVTEVPANAAPENSPGSKLIGDFLRTDDWSNSGIRQFIQKWNDLPPKEQENARNDYRFPRLVSELNQQIVSQQAMSALTKNKQRTQTVLANLHRMADTLGIPNQSGD